MYQSVSALNINNNFKLSIYIYMNNCNCNYLRQITEANPDSRYKSVSNWKMWLECLGDIHSSKLMTWFCHKCQVLVTAPVCGDSVVTGPCHAWVHLFTVHPSSYTHCNHMSCVIYSQWDSCLLTGWLWFFLTFTTCYQLTVYVSLTPISSESYSK